MLRAVDEKMIGLKLRCHRFLQDLREEERGASDIVAILLIIVVVVAVAAIFKTQLTSIVKTVFGKINTFIGS